MRLFNNKQLLLWNVFEFKDKNTKKDEEEKLSTDKLSKNNNKHENKSKVKFRGRRKGAIYGIKWSLNGKYLCYVSDDRSVQLWKFINSTSLQMVYRVYGHQARVFDCWISDDGRYVVSIGEDSTCRVWNFDGELIDIFEFRYGQIWSLDVEYKQINEKQFNLYHVALGGADASIRLHYFLSKQIDNNNTAKSKDISISLNAGINRELSSNSSNLSDAELIPFKHHIDSKAFYQINLPNKYFPNLDDGKKKKKRGKKRGSSTNNIRMMVIDSKSRIIFATASDIYRVSNLSAITRQCKWEKIISLTDIVDKGHHYDNEDITTMKICRDLFSDYGHYRTVIGGVNADKSKTPTDLLSKFDISNAKFQHIPEDKSDSFTSSKNASQMSLNTTIKRTDEKIAENLHQEYERWLVIGTKTGRISIIDLHTNQNALTFRAHDIGIISLYSCITSFQPETLEDINNTETRAEKARKYKGMGLQGSTSNTNTTENDDKLGPLVSDGRIPVTKKKRSSNLRFSLSASDLHTMMTDSATNESYLKMWGNSSLMLFTSDGNGNIAYWCFPLSELQKPKESKVSTPTTTQDNQQDNQQDFGMNEKSKANDDNQSVASTTSSVAVKFDTMQTAVKSSATFMNPAKKQISAFCYLPPPKNILIVGDSRGSIMLFSLLNLDKRSMHKPMQVLKAMHGREPVSCIKVLSGIKYIHDKDKRFKDKNELKEESEQEDDEADASYYYADDMKENKYHIVSGGKDGKVVEYTFISKQEFDELGGFSSLMMGSTMAATHSARKSRSEYNLMNMVNDEMINDGEILMPIRPIASTSLSAVDDIILNKNKEMILTGFRSTDFIVWNCNQDYVLFRWNCGGVKRPHDYHLLYYDNENPQNDDNLEEKKLDDINIGYVNKIKNKKQMESLNPCRGWIFAYTNTNISNAIAVFHLDFPSSVPLGSLSRPYHSSEIHAIHWLLSPKEIFKMCQTDDIFDEIEEFVSSQQQKQSPDTNSQKLVSMVNKPLSEFFNKLVVASSGEDGLIQILSMQNTRNILKPLSNTTATSSIGLNALTLPRSSSKSTTSTKSGRNSGIFGLRAKDLQSHSIENDWKYPNAFDEEMYDKWILNFDPQESPPSHVINFVRQSIMEQNAGTRFPLKCCDMVKKSTGDAYLFFAGGAKEYLQGYQVTYNENEPDKIEWKSLCCTGGDSLNKQRGKRWKKHDQTIQAAIHTIDLRIKSVVVIPSPKYYGKWLIVTGNSRGTIRAYTFDEDRPKEFQFEGEDSTLHKDNNASSPVLSLTSTYSSETYYHFPSSNLSNFSPFNHNANSRRITQRNKDNTLSIPSRGDNIIKKQPGMDKLSMSFSAPLREDSSKLTSIKKQDRIISGYTELPPHLIFSGATDGWIRIWFWDIDSHSIQLVERLAVHQSGVNTISASWLDAKFINKNKNKNKRDKGGINNDKEPSPSLTSSLSVSPPPTGAARHGSQQSQPMSSYLDSLNNNDGLLTRRLAITTGGDDQSITLIIADFESTMSMSRAARKRKNKQNQLFRKSLSSSNLRDVNSTKTTLNNRATGWKFNVIREVPINTSHIASVRSVAITPIITPRVVEYFTKMVDKGKNDDNKDKDNDNNDDDEDDEKLRMNEILLMSTSDDQRLRCWYYKFEKTSFQSSSTIKENIELLDECDLDIGLPNCLSIYYIYNSGILLSVAGQGIQIITLPFSKYLFKKIYYNKTIRQEYRNKNKRKLNNDDDNRSSGSYDSSFSQNATNESINSNVSGV